MTLRRTALALLAGLLAFGASLDISRAPGPGLDPDAMSYVGAGESLARTGRLRTPDADWWNDDSTTALAQFPAGFPATIAVATRAGLAPVQAARAIEAVSAFVLAATLVILLDATAAAPAGILALLLLAATPAIFDSYIRVLSEPLFLACLALALAAMVTRPDRPLLAGLAGAAAELARYSGISIGLAAVLWAFGRSGGWRHRLERALEAALPVIVAHGWWSARLSGIGAARPAPEHLQRGMPATLAEGVRTIVSWLTPSLDPGVLTRLAAGIVLLAGAWLLHRAWRRMPRDARAGGRRRLFNAAALLAVCYAAVLLFSRAFVGGGIPFDERLLSPLFLLGTVVLAASVRIRWPAWSRGARAGVALTLTAWAVGGALLNRDQLEGMQDDGWGYSSREWQPSAEQRWLRSEGRNVPIYSNNPMLVYFLTGRPSRELPDTADAGTLVDFAGTLEEQHGVVVGFDEGYRRMDPPEFLAAVLHLRPVARFEHMAVWAPEQEAR